MRPKLVIPCIEGTRGKILAFAKEVVDKEIQMLELRVDYYEDEKNALFDLVNEVKEVIGTKELIVTLRSTDEGGEKNGDRFSYGELIIDLLNRTKADFVDVELEKIDEKLHKDLINLQISESSKADVNTTKAFDRLILSFHDFDKTPSEKSIVDKLEQMNSYGVHYGKIACMPQKPDDVMSLLMATEKVKKLHPDFHLITMSMGKMGELSRIWGGLYGSEVSFCTLQKASAPGQVEYSVMKEKFDKIYSEKKHIVLAGYMGTGKSVVAREINRITGKTVVDADEYIEKHENMSISEIFEKKGEAYFRELETEIIDDFLDMKSCVISCGGGMVLKDINVRKLKAMGTIYLLTASPETILERIKSNDTRPLLKNNMSREYIEKMLAQRMQYYKNAADFVIDTEGKTISMVAKEILNKLKK